MNEKEMSVGCPEGCIYKQFAYLPKLVAYPNISGINKLSEMPTVALESFLNTNVYTSIG